MKAAWQATEKFAVDSFAWQVEPVRLPPRTDGPFAEAASKQTLEDAKATTARRNNAAFQIAWHARKDRPIDVTCLELGRARVLHLPGEPFIEYQLFAQAQRPDLAVFVAGYGDDGTGYIPTAKGYLEGGYEPTVALAAPCEKVLVQSASVPEPTTWRKFVPTIRPGATAFSVWLPTF